MIVKNVFVFNRDTFEDDLIKELIVNGVSYVQIDHEIHFDNYIYRFHDPKQWFNNEVLNVGCFHEPEGLVDNEFLGLFGLEKSNKFLLSGQTGFCKTVPNNSKKRYSKKRIREDNARYRIKGIK